MTRPYDHEALWTKARLFLNHAMDSDEPRAFDERALWAALAFELLAKAALARVSPLLIASPTEDGTNLLVASGLIEGDARFTSVRAHTLMSRCHKAFRPFDEKQALQVINARNDYLHGGAPTFTSIPEDAWWPRYWAQASILVNALDRELDDLVGVARASVVEKHLAQNKRNIEQRFEMLIARARQRLAQLQSGELPARVAEEWTRSGDLTGGLSYHAEASCPACQETGVLEGEEVIDSELRYEHISDDDVEAWMDLTVGSDHFSCPNCRLVLGSYELIEQAGMPLEFSQVGDVSDYMEDDYGND